MNIEELRDYFEKSAIYLLHDHYKFGSAPLRKIIAYNSARETYEDELVEECWKAFQAAAEFINSGADSTNEFVFTENFESYIRKTYIKNLKSKSYLLDTYDGVMYENDDTSLFFEFWKQCYSWLVE